MRDAIGIGHQIFFGGLVHVFRFDSRTSDRPTAAVARAELTALRTAARQGSSVLGRRGNG
jgi:hypothetical protein